MITWKWRVLTVLCIVCIFAPYLAAQDIIWNDTINSLVFRPVFPEMPGRLSLKSDLDYNFSVSGCYFRNGPGDKTLSQISLQQLLKYSLRVSSKRFHLTNDLVHNLVLSYYIDSTCKFQTDENTLTTRISYDISRFLKFSASSILTTRIFNAWDVSQTAGGAVVRTISSSFLTPLICTLSGGFGFRIGKTGLIDVGVTSAKLTYILDRSIFDKTGQDSYFGVRKGRSTFLEYGLSLHLLIDRLIGRKIQWNCDLLLFKGSESPADMTFKNLFAYRINRFLRISLQTRLFYNKDVSRQLRIENLFSIGFDFHL